MVGYLCVLLMDSVTKDRPSRIIAYTVGLVEDRGSGKGTKKNETFKTNYEISR
jgi:hypothetical protein